jgi:hypothetical protein
MLLHSMGRHRAYLKILDKDENKKLLKIIDEKTFLHHHYLERLTFKSNFTTVPYERREMDAFMHWHL